VPPATFQRGTRRSCSTPRCRRRSSSRRSTCACSTRPPTRLTTTSRARWPG
jgi:hypothetical protein